METAQLSPAFHVSREAELIHSRLTSMEGWENNENVEIHQQ